MEIIVLASLARLQWISLSEYTLYWLWLLLGWTPNKICTAGFCSVKQEFSFLVQSKMSLWCCFWWPQVQKTGESVKILSPLSLQQIFSLDPTYCIQSVAIALMKSFNRVSDSELYQMILMSGFILYLAQSVFLVPHLFFCVYRIKISFLFLVFAP